MASPPNLDRVQAVKWESPDKGGTQDDAQPTGLRETEDALSGRGFYFQPAAPALADEEVAAWRDGDDLLFQDRHTGPHSLTALAEGGASVEFNRIILETNGQVVYTGDGDIVLRSV